MHLLKMMPAGVPVQILFAEGLDQDFMTQVVQSWGALEPELVTITEPDYSQPTVKVGLEDYADSEAHPAVEIGKFAYLKAKPDNLDFAAERLTVEVTLKMLEQLAGKTTLFHAAALGHEASQKGMILIGPSGRGKTTASRFLGQHFLYLSDETSVIDSDFHLHPYPKPLSVIVDPARPKQQINPVDEGMRALSPLNDEIELAHMVLLNRQDGVPTPYAERVPLADALLGMVSETSGLDVSEKGLNKLNDLINHCGGVLRVTYTEIGDTLPIFTSLFEGGLSLDGEWQPEAIELLESNEDATIAEVNTAARAKDTSLLQVGERYLMVSGRQLLEPSNLCIDIWARLEKPMPSDQLKKELMEDYGEIPDETYQAFISDLRGAGILQ